MALFHNVDMKKNQIELQKNKRPYNAKLPNDPQGRIDRLLKRIDLAVQRLESAVLQNNRDLITKHARLITDMEKEIHEWKQLKK